jgi:hypothetical protein
MQAALSLDGDVANAAWTAQYISAAVWRVAKRDSASTRVISSSHMVAVVLDGSCRGSRVVYL